MIRHFYQSSWDQPLVDDVRKLVEAALSEDLAGQQDWTTHCIVPEKATAVAEVVSREDGVFVGGKIAELVRDTGAQSGIGDFTIDLLISDGDQISSGQTAMKFAGNARDILSLERTILNFSGRLSGIATKTKQFVELVGGTKAEICDTRKTTPGWRRLEKYAVRCGGGTNHRMGLYDAILIKDNHLAFAYDQDSDWDRVMKQAIENARKVAAAQKPEQTGKDADGKMIVEVEVDSIEQLKFVIDEHPDIVLLDNMTNEQLREAVSIRDKDFPNVALEASGGVNLTTVADIAKTGVDRISIGALTHSAVNFDLGLDWK